MHIGCAVYFHGPTCLAVSLRIAALAGFAAFSALLVQRPTESVLVIRPLLLDERLINALLIRVVAFNLCVNPLLIRVEALIKLLYHCPAFLIPSIVPAGCTRVGLSNTETASPIRHVHVLVSRLVHPVGIISREEAPSNGLTCGCCLRSIVSAGTRLVFF